MNRLLRIGLDNFLLSFIPIVSWFFLGLIGSSDLIVIFSLTYPLAFFIPINYIISDKTKQNVMATDSSSSDLTLEDLAKDYIKEDYREWFLRYCEETFCVMRTDFVSQETCDAYYEYFKKNRWR